MQSEQYSSAFASVSLIADDISLLPDDARLARRNLWSHRRASHWRSCVPNSRESQPDVEAGHLETSPVLFETVTFTQAYYHQYIAQSPGNSRYIKYVALGSDSWRKHNYLHTSPLADLFFSPIHSSDQQQRQNICQNLQ